MKQKIYYTSQLHQNQILGCTFPFNHSAMLSLKEESAWFYRICNAHNEVLSLHSDKK
ncbi:MAG: hypothetical protein ACI9Y7_000928 [Dokdonia sp.]|jgi:hypothetical protein